MPFDTGLKYGAVPCANYNNTFMVAQADIANVLISAVNDVCTPRNP